MSLYSRFFFFNVKVQAASWFSLLYKYNEDEQIKIGEMSGACSMHGRDMHTDWWLENFK